MYLKRLKPYILEFVSFFFVCVFVGVVLIGPGFVIFKWNFFTISFMFLTALWFIIYLFTFVPFAILVIVDLLTKKL